VAAPIDPLPAPLPPTKPAATPAAATEHSDPPGHQAEHPGSATEEAAGAIRDKPRPRSDSTGPWSRTAGSGEAPVFEGNPAHSDQGADPPRAAGAGGPPGEPPADGGNPPADDEGPLPGYPPPPVMTNEDDPMQWLRGVRHPALPTGTLRTTLNTPHTIVTESTAFRTRFGCLRMLTHQQMKEQELIKAVRTAPSITPYQCQWLVSGAHDLENRWDTRVYRAVDQWTGSFMRLFGPKTLPLPVRRWEAEGPPRDGNAGGFPGPGTGGSPGVGAAEGS